MVAVGRLRPPYADDVQHYQKLIAGHAKLELVECREDEQVARRIPKRAHVTLLSTGGEQYDSVSFARRARGAQDDPAWTGASSSAARSGCSSSRPTAACRSGR